MSIEKLKKQMSKKYVDKGMPDPFREIEPITHLATGLTTLDTILGGGWAEGKMIELWGTPGAGKTTLALQTVAECQKRGQNCLFIDTERALNKEYAEKLGVNTENLLYVKPEYGEQAFDIALEYINSGEIKLVVLDSIASLLPKSTAERDMEKSEQAILARLLSRSLPKFVPACDNNKCTFIFINQIRHKVGIMYGNPEVTTGGEALKYGAFMRLELRHTEFIKEDDTKKGSIVRATCKKTKSTEPYKESELHMIFGLGFSKGYDLLQSMLNKGEIEKSGAWFLFKHEGKEKKVQGEDKMIQWLEENNAQL